MARQIPWSITDDRGRCVDLGTVPAESDQDALRAVLARPRKDLRAQGWYRVKAGGAVASAAGDEFTTVGTSAGMPTDAAGEAALAQAQRTRAEAEKGLRDLLADKARARKAERELDEAGKVAPAPSTDGRFKVWPVKSAKSDADRLAEAIGKIGAIPPGGIDWSELDRRIYGHAGLPCAGCGKPATGPYGGGQVMGEPVCHDCAREIEPVARGLGSNPQANARLRDIMRRRHEAGMRGRGTAGDIAREEAGVPAPRRSSGGCVLAVDTVRIRSTPSPMMPMDVLEASGNCANCGRAGGAVQRRLEPLRPGSPGGGRPRPPDGRRRAPAVPRRVALPGARPLTRRRLLRLL